MRFQQSDTNPNIHNNQDMIANKTKIEADSTIIGVPGAPILTKTTTGDNTHDKSEQAK
jgi:hypothetical protein